MSPGLLIVVSGPAGVGKGTVVRRLTERNRDIVFSVSATSRTPRQGEVDGKNYYFISREKFEDMIKNDQLIEWVEYCNNYYGTPKELVFREIENGNIVLLEIEVEGAINIKKKYPDCVLCFILPPDFEELENRLRGRGTETEDAVRGRLARAKEELQLISKYDYLIINDNVEDAAERFKCVILAEKMKTARNKSLID
ncbi:MAG: guanylate kinase, partial [Acetivibrionales bacterium]